MSGKPKSTEDWINDAKENSIVTPNGCWEWMKSRRNGYGETSYNGKHLYVHQVSAHIHLNYDLEDKEHIITHKCDNRPCWNPDHLMINTYSNNIRERPLKEFCGK